MKKLLIIAFIAVSINTSAQITNPGPYCTAPPWLGGNLGIIGNVTLGTINNITTIDSPYFYYNNISADTLYADSTYTLSVTFDTLRGGTADFSGAYIGMDFYHTTSDDYQFLNPGDYIDSIPVNDIGAFHSPVTRIFTFVVPSDAKHGLGRLRVIRNDVDTPARGADPLCGPGYLGYTEIGETQDYDIYIINHNDTVSYVTPIAANAYKVYPNPVKNTVQVTASGRIIIYDMLGHCIYSNTEYKANEPIDISALPIGLFTLSVNNYSQLLQKQ